MSAQFNENTKSKVLDVTQMSSEERIVMLANALVDLVIYNHNEAALGTKELNDAE